MTDRTAERLVSGAFVLAALAGVALLGLYLAGGQTQLEAVLLALCLGGIGAGLIVWAQRLLPHEEEIEERGTIATVPATAREERLADEAAGAELAADTRSITRRVVLIRFLAGAFAGLAAALAIPILSLGPAPGRSLFVTAWRQGLRLVDGEGVPVTADRVPVGGIVTVLPEGSGGAADPSAADAQAVLINLGDAALRDPSAAAPVGGFVCFSKVCTHAGCPVGLYRSPEHVLVCPCHQSAFDILAGAHPVAGPAVRPLPRLPIRLEADGTFTALGDFPAPVGPSFWDLDLGRRS